MHSLDLRISLAILTFLTLLSAMIRDVRGDEQPTSQPASAPATQPAASLTARVDARIDEAVAKLHLPSVAVGVIRGDAVVHKRAVGIANRETNTPATCDTLYGIGSITKTFTGTLLVVLRDEGVVAHDDPIAKYLPPDLPLPTDKRGDPRITLRHLATHTSGLPRLPPNLMGFLPDPYASYDAERLYKGIAASGLIAPIGAKCQYSNFGVGLLGHLLERASGKGYDELLQTRIFDPLEMTHTYPRPTPELFERMARPYKGAQCEDEANSWSFDVLAPAGSIVSNVNDMLKYVALQFHAGDAFEKPVRGSSLAELHRPQRLVNDKWDVAVGLCWHIRPEKKIGDVVWHNGALDGFHSYVGFSQRARVGVVVLTNCDKDIDGLAMDILRMVALDQK